MICEIDPIDKEDKYARDKFKEKVDLVSIDVRAIIRKLENLV